MNLAIKDLRRRRGRFLSTSIAVGTLIGAVIIQAGIYRGTVADATSLTQVLKSDLWVMQPEIQTPISSSSQLPTSARNLVGRLYGVAETGRVILYVADAVSSRHRIRVFVVGYEMGALGGPAKIVAGRGLRAPRHESVVDRGTGFRIGERIRIMDRPFTVVGYSSRTVTNAGDPVVFVNLRDARDLQFKSPPTIIRQQRAAGLDPRPLDRINAVIAKLRTGVDPHPVIRQIERWKHLRALSRNAHEVLVGDQLVRRVRSTLAQFALILIFATTAILTLTVHNMTVEKTRDIATLKLVGADNGVIIRLVLHQALAMGGIGFLFGNLIARFVKSTFPGYLEFTLLDCLSAGLMTGLICLVGSASGIRYALKVDPAQALAG